MELLKCFSFYLEPLSLHKLHEVFVTTRLQSLAFQQVSEVKQGVSEPCWSSFDEYQELKSQRAQQETNIA